VQLTDPIQEGARILTICNACRYCEGYCAVFPAMERRLNFAEADLNYLANLCHQCAECYYACQYAPPHEFAVNVPKTLAEIRVRSYQQYAWPRSLADAFPRSAKWASSILAGCLIFSVLAIATLPGMDSVNSDFYAVVPHGVMAGLFGGVSIFVLLALLIGIGRCWRESGKSLAQFAAPAALGSAMQDVLRLKYLDNGGAGCTYPREQHSQSRRWFHHFTFYGFLLCFAATSVAAIYHYVFGWKAPYGYFSLPVILGTAGGIGLLIGPAGLYWLKQHRDPSIADSKQDGMDVSFLASLFLTSITGLLLLALRQTLAMGPLLLIHLGVVLALFLTMPYGKFVHGLYRSAALVRYALERLRTEEQPTQLSN
jgi:citrate/tricarballylate utilization protein